MERLALTDAKSTFAKKEAESIKDALSLAIENFKESQKFKDKIFEGRFVFYCVRYEDGRDAVKKLYPNLDLTLSHLVRKKGLLRRPPHRLKEMHRLHQNLLQPLKLYLSKVMKRPIGDWYNIFFFFFI